MKRNPVAKALRTAKFKKRIIKNLVNFAPNFKIPVLQAMHSVLFVPHFIVDGGNEGVLV